MDLWSSFRFHWLLYKGKSRFLKSVGDVSIPKMEEKIKNMVQLQSWFIARLNILWLIDFTRNEPNKRQRNYKISREPEQF